MAFAFIKAALDRNSKAWEETLQKRREAGRKGGTQRVANQANATFACDSQANQANQAVPVPVPDPVPVPVKDKERGADKPPTRARFLPPTVEEVGQYCRERGNTINPEAFVDYYTANGWVQGKGKQIKDWKAAVRTWERREPLNPKQERERVKTAADYDDGGDFFND